MDEKKLNDKELILLFKRCIGGSADSCRTCPYKTSYTHCKIEKLHNDVLNLAIRLYRKNAQLKAKLRKECEEHEEIEQLKTKEATGGENENNKN